MSVELRIRVLLPGAGVIQALAAGLTRGARAVGLAASSGLQNTPPPGRASCGAIDVPAWQTAPAPLGSKVRPARGLKAPPGIHSETLSRCD
jgi:hypothetical protein